MAQTYRSNRTPRNFHIPPILHTHNLLSTRISVDLNHTLNSLLRSDPLGLIPLFKSMVIEFPVEATE